MKIYNLVANNIKDISYVIPENVSIGIGGLSGSGKSTFCATVSDESIKRVVTMLPKTDYRFLFGDKLKSNYSAQAISDLPLVFYLGKSGFSSNPRSTVGTHTGVYKEIREKYALEYNKASEFFSFNNSIMWCEECKGRGTFSGKTCKRCNGLRYMKDIESYPLLYKGMSKNITDINAMNAEDILSEAEYLGISETKKNILKNMVDLNVGYLSLERVMSTLSGGETVRVLLAEFMAQCVNSLVIIDEISIGLDRDTLVNVIEKVSKLGNSNQIWLIDHSDIVLKSTKVNLFFGPESGKNGGRIVEKSPRPVPIYRNINIEDPEDYYIFEQMKKRNVDINKILIPKNRITVITGESGCGKSTLVNECMIPYFAKKYKSIKCDIIGQDRNQSITSKSTVATFLDIKKKLDKFDDSVMITELSDVRDVIKKDKNIVSKVDMLIQLGLGYLTFERKVQTLSTGEFQCLHLVSKLSENKDNEMLLIFDEPSKGLSQNILNLFIEMMNKILEDSKKTILIIEHNPYILKCSDFILDFGKRKKENVTELKLLKGNEWNQNIDENKYLIKLNSKMIVDKLKGIKVIENQIDKIFSDYENRFKGGLLKNLSSTAQWIYSEYKSDIVEPIITIDLEKTLYSKKTFLYEISGLINHIIAKSGTINTTDFDFYSKDNLCECCNGTCEVKTIDFNLVVNDSSKGLWNGLLKEEVMIALKKYNYSKIKFLFKEVKKEIGYDLDKPFSKMSKDERIVFLYGYWKNSFYDKNKKTQRKWQGIIHLITKYMRSSKSELKQKIVESKKAIVCPICNGSVLCHEKQLTIQNSKDIRQIVVSPIKDVVNMFSDIQVLSDIMNIVGEEAYMNMDISELSVEKQVRLKINELLNNNFLGFTIVLKNTVPFKQWINEDIKKISEHNKVLLLDYAGISETKEELLNKFFSKGKIKSTSFVYEIMGYKKISTEINKIRKSKPCKYCNGSKVLKEESIFEGVNVTETPCHSCKETGIDEIGLKLNIEGIEVKQWLLGTLSDIKNDVSDDVADISPMAKISELNKAQLYKIKKYLEDKKC